jgi:hypothetical protein
MVIEFVTLDGSCMGRNQSVQESMSAPPRGASVTERSIPVQRFCGFYAAKSSD